MCLTQLPASQALQHSEERISAMAMDLEGYTNEARMRGGNHGLLFSVLRKIDLFKDQFDQFTDVS